MEPEPGAGQILPMRQDHTGEGKKITGTGDTSPSHSPPWGPQHGLERLGLPRAHQHPLELLTTSPACSLSTFS